MFSIFAYINTPIVIGIVLKIFLPKKANPVIVKIAATPGPEITTLKLCDRRVDNKPIKPALKNAAPMFAKYI